MAILEHAVRERFGREVIHSIRQASPHYVQGLTSAEIDNRLATALRKADRYEFQLKRDLRAFIRLCFVVGPNFDEYPPFQALINSPKTPPHLRITRLFDGAKTEDWNKAAVFDVMGRSRGSNNDDLSLGSDQAQTRNPAHISQQPILIERLTLDHAEPYFHLALHPDIWHLVRTIPHLNIEETEKFIQSTQMDTDRVGFAIVKPDSSFVGVILVYRRSSTLLITYWVGRPFWGKVLRQWRLKSYYRCFVIVKNVFG